MLKFLSRARFLVLAIAALFITSCKNNSSVDKPIDPAFTQYVQSFSSGVLSNSDAIRISLTEAQPDIQVNQLIEQELFEFDPKIEGKAFWLDKYTIEFQPSEPLENGRKYQVEFALGKIRETSAALSTFEFSFETLKQHINFQIDGIEAIDVNKLEWQQVKGILYTADVATSAQAEACIKASQKGNSLKLIWEHEANGTEHRFKVDSVKREDVASEVLVASNGNSLGLSLSHSEKITIPALGDFKLVNVSVNAADNQCIVLNFSDPVDRKQNINGLISINSGVQLDLKIEGNEIKCYPGTRLTTTQTLTVNSGIKSTGGYKLGATLNHELIFRNELPQVALLTSGNIIPSANGAKLPFKAVNLKAVQVDVIQIFQNNIGQFFQDNSLSGSQNIMRVGRIVLSKAVKLESEQKLDLGVWNQFALNLDELFKKEPGAFYRIRLSMRPEHSIYPCTEAIESFPDAYDKGVEEAFDGSRRNYSYYNDEFYFYDIPFNWGNQNDPCKPEYYMRGKSKSVNIIASNLAVIAKKGDAKTMHVAVTSIDKAGPVKNCQVEVFNYQSQSLGTVSTDKEGMAKIPLTNNPFYLTAKSGNDVAYLKVDHASALSVSMFNVGGQAIADGINGYIYGERGVWRPGDSLYLNFILQDQLKELPKGHPVILELYNPDNQVVERITKTTSVGNIYSFYTKTSAEAPTGNWLAKVKVGGASFSKTIKIETVKPNRLKIELNLDDEFIRNGDEQEIGILSKWLHGAKAKGLKADVKLNLAAEKTTFEDYPGFIFDDPTKSFYAQEQEMFNGALDQEGKASFKPNLEVTVQAPGMLKATFISRVFEEGGNFSIARKSFKYSGYDGYIGMKVPKGDGWNGAIYGDKDTWVPIVAIDENGKGRTTKVVVERYNVRWRWWWDASEREDLAQYVRQYGRHRIEVDTIDVIDGKAQINLKSDQRYWGRRFMRIVDLETGHSTGQTYYMSYSYWWSDPAAEGPGGAEMLSFSTDKEQYNVGDEVRVQLPENKLGRALVSVESGTELIDWFWVDVAEGENSFTFQTKPSMAPNVFVNIAMVQPYESLNPDIPIRLYGIENIKVHDPNTKLQPKLEMPEKIKPESKYTVEVSEENGKAMTYTLAVVDEGILDLTGFKTPNPWNTFYMRKALGVKTWDLYQYIMGSYTGNIAALLALGGDDELNKSEEDPKKANRFKPVVKHVGPFKLEAGKTAKHILSMPNYVGSVRAMVVAESRASAFGCAEVATPVKQPLMVLATLPRLLSPGETVSLPVTIFAMEEGIKNVKVQVEASDLIEMTSKSQTVKFDEIGDHVVFFDFKVKDRVGIAKFDVSVSSGSAKAKNNIELEVRVPSPRITDITSYVLEPGKSVTGSFDKLGMIGTNELDLEFSLLPPMNLGHRLNYLIRYPYGCIEQTTSSVFPQLNLDAIKNLSEQQKMDIDKNIRAGITRLLGFQRNDGGMSYWPNSYLGASEWGTNYAGHFLLMAASKGYAVPSSFTSNWLQFQTKTANAWTKKSTTSGYHYGFSDELIQAYRLYTLALAGKPAYAAMNRLRAQDELSIQAKWRLAAAYAVAGDVKVAKEITNGLSISIDSYRRGGYTYGSSTRDEAMICESLLYMGDVSRAKTVLDKLAKVFGTKEWLSTQTTAYGLLAFAQFVKLQDVENGMKYSLSVSGTTDKYESQSPVQVQNRKFEGSEKLDLKLENTSGSVLFVQVQNHGYPSSGAVHDISRNLDMYVKYTDLKGNTIDVSSLKQGTDFMVEIRVSNPTTHSYTELALRQLFASGWEIRNTRMDGTQSAVAIDVPDYENYLDDRVYSFFNLEPNKAKTFRYQLNASYKGTFYLPPVVCEAMYDDQIYNAKGGLWVQVVD